MWPEDCLAPYFEYNPPLRSPEPKGEEVATEDLNLGEPLELKLEVTYFLQGSAESSGEEDVKVPSPKSPIEDLQKWVTWNAWTCKPPSWWQELTVGPGVDDYKKLAHEVQASFQFPKRLSELHQVKNDQQALPALLCLCQKSFLPPPDSIFACWDIWEIPCEKMVAYTQALQFWVEKGNPPTRGKPHLLAGSVKKLQEEMRCYLSFSDEDVLKGVALPDEVSAPPTTEAAPPSIRSEPTGTPEEEAIVETAMEPAAEKRAPE